MGQIRGAIVVIALMLFCGACSNDGPETSASTAESSTTSTTDAPATTSTTAAPTTTTTIATTTTTVEVVESPWNADEQAVIRSGHIFWDLIVRANTPAASVDDPDYFRFITGPALTLMIEVTERQLANGEDVRGPVYLQPTTVQISGFSAILTECVLDAVDTLDANGVVIEPADLAPTVWRSDLIWSGEEWQTSRFTRLDGTCFLNEETATVVPLSPEVYDEPAEG